MGNTPNRMTPADALVIFGVTGDLAYKMIFPALYAMARRGVLNVPVVGVAAPKWSLAQLRKQATDSIRQAGKIDDRDALDHFLSLLQYVGGDYNDLGTFKLLKQALGDARRPAHYLVIPPALAEDFGVKGRGAFYESAGCLRDVIQNHLFQIVALLAMEAPAYQGYGAVHSEKAKVFQAMRPLHPDDVVRGQYTGYCKEAGVAKGSDVETFCALRLFIDSWRWAGVPWYLRSGKCLAATAAEVMVELKPPPQRLFDDSRPVDGQANYLRFRLSPNSAVALAARVKRAGKEFIGDQRELYLLEEQPGKETPYERLLGDALAGNGALFTREDAVEAAWAAVDPVLNTHHRARRYKPGSWGPKQADALIAADGGWHNPILVKAAT